MLMQASILTPSSALVNALPGPVPQKYQTNCIGFATVTLSEIAACKVLKTY